METLLSCLLSAWAAGHAMYEGYLVGVQNMTAAGPNYKWPGMDCRAMKTHVAHDKEMRLRTKGYMGKRDRQPSVMKGASGQWML